MRDGWRTRILALGGWLLLVGCAIDELREDDVGESPTCRAAQRWPHEQAEREDELLEAVTDLRARGGRCGDLVMPPTAELDVAPELRCAARLHASDLAENLAEGGELSHVGVNGSSPQQRMQESGYAAIPVHELLAGDFEDPGQVLEAWLALPEYCEALHDPTIDDVGIGHGISASGEATAWVLVTGRRPE